MHGNSILRNHGEYHLELIIRARASISSLHSRDEALALISIPLLERGASIYHDGRWSGSVGWAAERKRCGSVDRKPEPEASRVNGRFSDCTLRSRLDKNVLVCRLRWNSIAPNSGSLAISRNPTRSLAGTKLDFYVAPRNGRV